MQRRQRAVRGDLEDRAIAVFPAGRRCPIEVPIGGLDQARQGRLAVRATGLRTKIVKRGQCAVCGNCEHRAVAVCPATIRNPIEFAIRGLDRRPFGDGAVRAVEAVQSFQLAASGDLEDRAVVGGSATRRRSVEVAIGVLDHPIGLDAVRAVEAVQRLQRAGCGDLEDRAIAVGSALLGCPEEVPISGLD